MAKSQHLMATNGTKFPLVSSRLFLSPVLIPAQGFNSRKIAGSDVASGFMGIACYFGAKLGGGALEGLINCHVRR
jgi:hypothetical protein